MAEGRKIGTGKFGRRRVKISATLDPELLDGVDAYVNGHPDRDRSKVLDEALMLWLAHRQEREMIEQFEGDDAPMACAASGMGLRRHRARTG